VDRPREDVLPGGTAFRLELLDGDVRGRVAVVLGDAVAQDHVQVLRLGHGLGRLAGTSQRAGVDGVDPLVGQVVREVAGLVDTGLRQAGIGGA
jgi:hypothetical protein